MELETRGKSREVHDEHNRHDVELRDCLENLEDLGQTARQPGRRGGHCEHMTDKMQQRSGIRTKATTVS